MIAWAAPALLAASLLAACAAPPPPHPPGELYLSAPSVPRALPSTDDDPNGGAN